MLKLSNIRVRAFDIGYLAIAWDIEPCFESVGDYEFQILRAEAEFGPYVAVTPWFRNRTQVRDGSVKNWRSFYTRIYYRVVVRQRTDTTNTAAYPELGGAKLGALPDLVALEMARQVNLTLKEFSGRQVWVFPRRRTGERCTTCIDPVRQRKTQSACRNCYDVGIVGGYDTPVQVWGQILSPDEQTRHTTVGSIETQDSLLRLGNYPELGAGDLVVEAENLRWRVGERIAKDRKARALVKQNAPIHLVEKSDIEYFVPVNLAESDWFDLVASPERNYTNPQSMSSMSLTDALRTVYSK